MCVLSRLTGIRGWLAATALVAASCGPAGADPVFLWEEIAPSAGECAGAGRCVDVRAGVAGSGEGHGSCVVHGAGDPDQAPPLVHSGPLRMRPNVVTVWRVAVPAGVPLADLDPVCRPMIEG